MRNNFWKVIAMADYTIEYVDGTYFTPLPVGEQRKRLEGIIIALSPHFSMEPLRGEMSIYVYEEDGIPRIRPHGGAITNVEYNGDCEHLASEMVDHQRKQPVFLEKGGIRVRMNYIPVLEDDRL
ncbi:MAG: hypothetical protein EPN86_01800 [Nanoarchaeota archaeon]|nr:MAG: hypothetical protein EPN86_01800 [Nanoarchaeota archaeon]